MTTTSAWRNLGATDLILLFLFGYPNTCDAASVRYGERESAT
jgi:hypothetical protein